MLMLHMLILHCEGTGEIKSFDRERDLVLKSFFHISLEPVYSSSVLDNTLLIIHLTLIIQVYK